MVYKSLLVTVCNDSELKVLEDNIMFAEVDENNAWEETIPRFIELDGFECRLWLASVEADDIKGTESAELLRSIGLEDFVCNVEVLPNWRLLVVEKLTDSVDVWNAAIVFLLLEMKSPAKYVDEETFLLATVWYSPVPLELVLSIDAVKRLSCWDVAEVNADELVFSKVITGLEERRLLNRVDWGDIVGTVDILIRSVE